MKTAKVLAATIFAFASVPFIAQQQAAPPDQQGAPPAAAAAPVNMNPVNGELVDKLDSKTAKAGDSVVIKTVSAVKTTDGTEIPKGSKLVGHVTGVKPSGEGNENSQVSLQFDRAELQGGQSMAIRSELESLSPSEGGSPSTPMANAPSGMNGTSQPGSSASGSSGASTPAQPQSSSASDSPTQPAPGTLVARTGNIQIRTTSIPGILLASNEPGLQDPRMGQASGILLGAKRDIHLDGGTKVVINVASAQPNGN